MYMARGTLRIFLGAATGVGMTFAMLQEARQLMADLRELFARYRPHDAEDQPDDAHMYHVQIQAFRLEGF